MEQLKSIEDGNRLELLKIALKLPDIFKTEVKSLKTEIELIETSEKSIDHLIGFRTDEGKFSKANSKRLKI